MLLDIFFFDHQAGIDSAFGSTLANRAAETVGFETVEAMLVALVDRWAFGTLTHWTSVVVFQISMCTLLVAIFVRKFNTIVTSVVTKDSRLEPRSTFALETAPLVPQQPIFASQGTMLR